MRVRAQLLLASLSAVLIGCQGQRLRTLVDVPARDGFEVMDAPAPSIKNPVAAANAKPVDKADSVDTIPAPIAHKRKPFNRNNVNATQWTPYTQTPSLTLKTTEGPFTIQELPQGAHFADSIIFSLIDSSIEYSDSWRLYHYPLGNNVWTVTDAAQFVFLSYAKTEAGVKEDMQHVKSKIDNLLDNLSASSGAKKYWSPRFHYSVDVIGQLSDGWFPDFMDAWTRERPTVAIQYNTVVNGDDTPVIRRFDASPTVGKWAEQLDNMRLCMAGKEDGVCGEFAYFGSACMVNGVLDGPHQEVEGKIALIERGICDFASKVAAAERFGAIAVVVYTQEDVPKASMSNSYPDYKADIPVVMIDHEPGLFIKTLLLAKDVVEVEVYNRIEGPSLFGVDRLGRIREFGDLKNSLSGTVMESWYFDYQERVAEATDRKYIEGNVMVVLDPDTLGQDNPLSATVKFENWVGTTAANKLQVHIQLQCFHRAHAYCPVFTKVVRVLGCAVGGKNYDCDAPLPKYFEVSRLMAAYGMETETLLDATPLLGAINQERKPDGSFPPFKFFVEGGEGYNPYLAFVFSRSTLQRFDDRLAVPIGVVDLWQGGIFKNVSAYNDNHKPITLDVPKDAAYVDIVATVTGHGHDADTGCAEHCVTAHHFNITDGINLALMLDEAADAYYCSNQTFRGVTPNQYGPWIHGRAGWCSGQGVEAALINRISNEALKKNRKQKVTYSANLVKAASVDLEQGANATGEIYTIPYILMSSYAVYYGVTPSAPLCELLVDRVNHTLEVATAMLKCSAPKDLSGFPLKTYNIYIRPLEDNETLNAATFRFAPAEPETSMLLGQGWKVPNLEYKRAYEVNVTAETWLGEGTPYMNRLALSPEVKVPPIQHPKKSHVGSGAPVHTTGHKSNKVGVAVGTTFGVVALVLLVGFLGAKVLKGVKFLGGKKYHDLDGNGEPRRTADVPENRSPAAGMSSVKPRETEMTSV